MNSPGLLVHEFGHIRQAEYLGWAYLNAHAFFKVLGLINPQFDVLEWGPFAGELSDVPQACALKPPPNLY